MSLLTEQEIACPMCKIPTLAEVWSIINVREDPELKDLLLGGEINMMECPSCKKVSYAEYFLIYHDPTEQLMAFVYPYENRDHAEVWLEKTRVDFQQTQELSEPANRLIYPPITIFGLHELVQMVEREEEMLLQGEIVEELSRQKSFPIAKLTPTIARQSRLPTVMPFRRLAGKSDKDALLASLAELETINDRLSVYTDLSRSLRDPSAPTSDLSVLKGA